MWALDYLHRIGATRAAEDFRRVLPQLLERTIAAFESNSPADYAKHGSLLFGDMGAALLAMRLAPTPHLADLEDTPQGPLWTQDLYGASDRWLGHVHGFAGNVIPLSRGWDWLTPPQQAQVAEFVPNTLAANAWPSEVGTNWGARSKRERPPTICQHCHGAPGMVTTFADAPFATPEFDALLVDAGRFTWAAGPLTKGSDGNGYAFLKLYRRTNDPIWLDRARQFAVTAIVQYRGSQAVVGRGRYSLWTGDVGLAIYLWDCITAQPRFPTIDVF
jgi:Lanthionine synthetase C-like protein